MIRKNKDRKSLKLNYKKSRTKRNLKFKKNYIKTEDQQTLTLIRNKHPLFQIIMTSSTVFVEDTPT